MTNVEKLRKDKSKDEKLWHLNEWIVKSYDVFQVIEV